MKLSVFSKLCDQAGKFAIYKSRKAKMESVVSSHYVLLNFKALVSV